MVILVYNWELGLSMSQKVKIEGQRTWDYLQSTNEAIINVYRALNIQGHWNVLWSSFGTEITAMVLQIVWQEYL
jgi:hypothetical protein